jgi:hypothetical protein
MTIISDDNDNDSRNKNNRKILKITNGNEIIDIAWMKLLLIQEESIEMWRNV